MAGHQIIEPASAQSIQASPLLVAIRAYRDLYAAHNALPEDADEDTVGHSGDLLCEANDVLVNWNEPAPDHQTAREALRLAEREMATGTDSPVAHAMYKAASGLWKRAVPPEENTLISFDGLAADTLVTPHEAAQYLRVSEATLGRWRSEQYGPIYVKLNGGVLYRVSALLAFVDKSERRGTRS